MTINEADKYLNQQLQHVYDSREAFNIANLVMEKLTGFTKSLRLINKQQLLTIDQQKSLKVYINELINHRPVQYVLNEAWFAGMKFFVDENVLIPRPETEELVEEIIKQTPGDKLNILDIGTGSGCIAIALKKKLKNATVYAIDISKKAIEIAKMNALQNNVAVHFINLDFLHPQENFSHPEYNIIVSNPPYIKRSESGEMEKNVLQYEPDIALFVADEDPLLFYRTITDFALKYLQPGYGKLFFEINEALGNEVANLLNEKRFSDILIKKDMQGKDRMAIAILKSLKK